MIGNNVLDDEANDAIEVGHKIVGWKITPRVSCIKITCLKKPFAVLSVFVSRPASQSLTVLGLIRVQKRLIKC